MEHKEYALETMDEGVLIIAGDGNVVYSNRKAQQIFEIQERSAKLFQDMIGNSSGINDGIIDLVIDTIASGQPQKSRVIRYTGKTGILHHLLTSCTKMEDNAFVFTFSDQTELIREGQKRIDSTTILTSFFVIACLWTVGVSIWMRTGEIFGVGHLTSVMEAIAAIDLLFILKRTSIQLKDMGLSLQNIVPTLKRTAVRVAVLLAVFCLGKAAVMIFRPGFFKEGQPFWDWQQADIRLLRYIGTALIQEFLARGGVQSALGRVFDGRHGKHFAIFVTSLYFMSLHFQYGLPMMLGSGALSLLLGYIYKKDDNIYGVTIVHYCFGKFADFLGFL